MKQGILHIPLPMFFAILMMAVSITACLVFMITLTEYTPFGYSNYYLWHQWPSQFSFVIPSFLNTPAIFLFQFLL